MSIPGSLVLRGTIVAMLFGAGVASAQTYPSKPLRLITGAAGSGADFLSRLVAPELRDRLGQPVIIDNRASALTADIVAKAPPDGYTLLIHGSTLWVGPLLKSTSYDPIKDFVPISMLGRSPLLVVVHPSLQVTSVKELIAHAKAKPGALNYASGGAGGSSHLAAELFKSMAGVDITRISYRGAAAALNDVLGNHVHMMFNTGTAAPHVKSGKLRALAITSAQPSPQYPGLPTVAASGVPGYQSVSVDGMFVPAKTPQAVVNRLNQEVAAAAATQDLRTRLLANGVEAVSSSPDELAAHMKSEMARLGKLIRDVGIGAE